MLGEPAAFHAFAPDWSPLFWNLSERTPEQLLQTGREWLQALAVVRAQEESADTFQRIFEEAVQRLTALHGRDRVRWQVRTWDTAGRVSSWSTESSWEMGLLSAADWGAGAHTSSGARRAPGASEGVLPASRTTIASTPVVAAPG